MKTSGPVSKANKNEERKNKNKKTHLRLMYAPKCMHDDHVSRTLLQNEEKGRTLIFSAGKQMDND